MMTNDNQRSETLDRIARKLANAASFVGAANTQQIGQSRQKLIGMAHMVASAALEELDKLVVKESLTPMFGGE